MPALSQRQRVYLQGTWSQLAHGLIYIVVDGDRYCIEKPADPEYEGDPDPTETVIKVWTDQQEAWHYCVEQQILTNPDEQTMRVEPISLEQLFGLRATFDRDSVQAFGIPTRAEVCQLREGETVVLDTLWMSPAADNLN